MINNYNFLFTTGDNFLFTTGEHIVFMVFLVLYITKMHIIITI